MKFKITVDNIEFVLDELLFEKTLKQLEIMYRLTDYTCLSLISLDSPDLRKYLTEKLKDFVPNLYDYDLEKANTNLKDLNNCVKNQPTVLLNLENYYPRVSQEHNCSIDDAKELIFSEINMARDDVFAKYNSVFFLILNEVDYRDFLTIASEFVSYCIIKIDFNSCFVNSDNISLSDYYILKTYSKTLKK